MVTNFLKDLYKEEANLATHRSTPIAFPPLTEQEIENASRPFTITNISTALQDKGPFKAPGLDGYHVAFFEQN